MLVTAEGLFNCLLKFPIRGNAQYNGYTSITSKRIEAASELIIGEDVGLQMWLQWMLPS